MRLPRSVEKKREERSVSTCGLAQLTSGSYTCNTIYCRTLSLTKRPRSIRGYPTPFPLPSFSLPSSFFSHRSYLSNAAPFQQPQSTCLPIWRVMLAYLWLMDLQIGFYRYPCPCGDIFIITLEELQDGEVREVCSCRVCALVSGVCSRIGCVLSFCADAPRRSVAWC